MKVIFGTTNERKVEDLRNQSIALGIDLEILGLNDIGWNLGEIEENGITIEENSLIKANAIYNFCQKNNIDYPIITDDAGLFCEALNGEPGIYTGRYADAEREKNPYLPKHQCVIKLLDKMRDVPNRKAMYRCAVTCMFSDGTYFQELGSSLGKIAEDIIGTLKKPYFYSVFILDGYEKAFSDLTTSELENSYRFVAIRKVLTRLSLKDENLDPIFDVRRYRQHLEAYYRYPYDENTFIKRKRNIDKLSDEYLSSIVNNTREFTLYLLNKMKRENKTFQSDVFTSVDIREDYRHIRNGCIGGWHCDELYSPRDFNEDFWISRRLMREFFRLFRIEIDDHIEEYYDEDEGIGFITSNPKLHISGPITVFEQLCDDESLGREKRKELVKVLLLINDKKNAKKMNKSLRIAI